MADTFGSNAQGLESPATRHYLIVPSDTVDLPFIPRRIVCLTAGTIQVRDAAGTQIGYALAAGETLDFRAARVRATGTTGTYAAWY